MSSADTTNWSLEDIDVNVKVKLAALWTSFMFLYVYVDVFGFFKPGTIENILRGQVFTFQITPAFILVALVSVTIPNLMIFLSLVLPARVNRLTNLVVGFLYIPYSLFNLLGAGSWYHYYFGAAVEVVLLGFVIWYAWHWPTTMGDG